MIELGGHLESLGACETGKQLDKVFAEYLSTHGYDKFLYSNCLVYGGFRAGFHVTKNMPDEWWETYEREGFEAHDPCMIRMASDALAFRWVDLYEIADEIGVKCLDQAAEAGLTNGISVPIRGPVGELCVVSAGGRSDFVPLEVVAEIHVVSLYYHECRQKHIVETRHQMQLTDLQCQHLSLIAEGLSVGDVADRFSVSPNTINKSLREIYSKLGVYNFQGAIARGIAYNLIRPRIAAFET